MQLKIEKSNDKYFVVLDRLELKNDKEVARVLRMTTSKYRKILVNKFYARQTIYGKDCYFYYEERAKEAKDWAESILLANKLF